MPINAPRFLPLAPRVVALHCSASSPSQWDAYHALVDPSVSWMAPPLQGYEPGSQWPAGASTSLAAEARRILALLANTSGTVDLVGHSYGGAVALQVAASWPERIRSVTVYEPVAFHLLDRDTASAPLAADVRRLAADIAAGASSGHGEEAGERFVDYWSGPGTWVRVGPARRAALARHMPKVSAEFGALLAATIDFGALEPPGPRVRLVAGTASPAPVRRIIELLHGLVPHATLEQVRGAGHMAPALDARTFAPLLFPEHAREPMALAA
jgi:pimeloyl-ACP methyl ester carboxylesterase